MNLRFLDYLHCLGRRSLINTGIDVTGLSEIMDIINLLIDYQVEWDAAGFASAVYY
jgi:hypothetical protein